MNVLFIATWYPYPPDNGSKLRTAYLLDALARTHEVTLLAFDFDTPELRSESYQFAPLTRNVKIPADPFQASTRRLKDYFLLRPSHSQLMPAMRAAILEVLQAERRYDAVILSTFKCAPYILELPRAMTRILEEHNSLTRWLWDHYRGQTSPIHRIRKWLSWQKTRIYEGNLFSKFDLITAVSQLDADAMRTMVIGNRTPVRVVANGVDCAHNHLARGTREPHTLIYNGALTYRANFEAMEYFLANIFPLIRAEVADAKLLITGSTSGVDITRLAIDDAVHFTGFVPDVRDSVAQAAVCVVPLRDGSGTRLKVLEAMALGTPVVATSKGAEGLALINGVHYLQADTPELFARATVSLLRSSDMREALRASARELVETKYDWRSLGAEFVRLTETAVAEKRSVRRGMRKATA